MTPLARVWSRTMHLWLSCGHSCVRLLSRPFWPTKHARHARWTMLKRTLPRTLPLPTHALRFYDLCWPSDAPTEPLLWPSTTATSIHWWSCALQKPTKKRRTRNASSLCRRPLRRPSCVWKSTSTRTAWTLRTSCTSIISDMARYAASWSRNLGMRLLYRRFWTRTRSTADLHGCTTRPSARMTTPVIRCAPRPMPSVWTSKPSSGC